MSRPEEKVAPELFYDDVESKKYTTSSRVQHIQADMTLRALELLNIPPSQHILDIGCGSGLSGEILTEEGHIWTGMDIAASMLAEAVDREVDGDLLLADMGQGVPFRAGSFDAAISISAIQWLCNADTSDADPKKRLKHFFETLYSCLKRGGKVACQFYPNNEKQLDAIQSAAKATGFSGGVVVDNMESKKNKKYYLVLTAGQADQEINLEGITMEEMKKRNHNKKNNNESKKEYINRKKDLMKKRGKMVAKDSKYTARKRRPKF